MTTFAYIRTSTTEQNSALQRDAIAAAGIPEKYVYADEGVSGSWASRPRLDSLLDRLDDGDEVVVWKLDRLGRNTRNVLELVDVMKSKGAWFCQLDSGPFDGLIEGHPCELGLLSVYSQRLYLKTP